MPSIQFVTSLNVIDRFSETEIVHRAAGDGADDLTGDQLRVTIEGGDRSGWTVEQREQADFAADAVANACDTANDIITGYVRSGGLLPANTAAVTIPLDAKRYAGDIARYLLYDDNYPQHVRQAYDDAMEWCKQVAIGNVTMDFGTADEPRGGGLRLTNIVHPLMSDDQESYY